MDRDQVKENLDRDRRYDGQTLPAGEQTVHTCPKCQKGLTVRMTALGPAWVCGCGVKRAGR